MADERVVNVQLADGSIATMSPEAAIRAIEQGKAEPYQWTREDVERVQEADARKKQREHEALADRELVKPCATLGEAARWVGGPPRGWGRR